MANIVDKAFGDDTPWRVRIAFICTAATGIAWVLLWLGSAAWEDIWLQQAADKLFHVMQTFIGVIVGMLVVDKAKNVHPAAIVVRTPQTLEELKTMAPDLFESLKKEYKKKEEEKDDP